MLCYSSNSRSSDQKRCERNNGYWTSSACVRSSPSHPTFLSMPLTKTELVSVITQKRISKHGHTRLIELCRKHENTLRLARCRWCNPCSVGLDFSSISNWSYGDGAPGLVVGNSILHRSSPFTSPPQDLMLIEGSGSTSVNSVLNSVPIELPFLASDLSSSFIVESFNERQYLGTNKCTPRHSWICFVQKLK